VVEGERHLKDLTRRLLEAVLGIGETVPAG
jgi:hypothetical protein